MNIRFVNHASVIVETRGERILFDPWIEGRIFNEGWDLLCETPLRYEDFGALTRIWFSHEHPDHFNPPNLRAIPEQIRAGLDVLYRRTKDGRVADFCRQLGFANVEEVPAAEWVEIAPGLRMMCAAYGEDSWIALDDGENRLLNLNDCELENREHAEAIRDKVGTVDLLMTQFSYASWAGTDSSQRRATARRILERVGMQTEVFEASWVLPFASFVWFCLPDNAENNDGMNRVGAVAEYIRDETEASPVVLYPDDEWQVGSEHDPSPGVERYEERYDALDAGRLVTAPPPDGCTEDELFEAGRKFSRSNREVSNRLLLRAYLAKMNADSRARLAGGAEASPWSALSLSVRLPKVWVTDLEKAYSLSVFHGLRPLRLGAEYCDLSMASDSLRYALELPWGSETLEINARYRARSKAARYAFFDQFRPARRLNHGYARLQLREIVPRLFLRIAG